MKLIPLKFVYTGEDVVNNYDELMDQLNSLREEAVYMMPTAISMKENIFKKDLIALRIIIQFLKDNKDLLCKK